MSAAPKIAVTGLDGFVGWHVRCAARARWGGDLVGLGINEFADSALLDAGLADVDAVIHLAGVNRAADPTEVEQTNPWLAEQLVASLRRLGRTVPVIYGSSIHSLGDSVFGVAKRKAAAILTAWGAEVGAPVADVLMPNLFGEHGLPNYNSVVATFCHTIAGGGSPSVVDDKELPLLHVGDAADRLLDLAASPESRQVLLEGRPTWVSDLAARLTAIATDYRSGRLPDLSDCFTKQLFNTYRSATFPGHFPIHPQPAEDPRGRLVEAVKGLGGQAQVFYSSTNPGFTRGQHWHRHKVERFLVLSGTGTMRLRRLFTDEVVEFPVSGDRPAIVDMPTFWAHSITNTGDEPMVTLFFADELFDPANPDTIPEEV
jgi:UDP-2-acetamido-2,6-beta-L-arabino-hexul-4-ose reductase